MGASNTKAKTDWFVVLGVPCFVVWNADGWRIHIGGQLIDRDVDVLSKDFLDDLEKQVAKHDADDARINMQDAGANAVMDRRIAA